FGPTVESQFDSNASRTYRISSPPIWGTDNNIRPAFSFIKWFLSERWWSSPAATSLRGTLLASMVGEMRVYSAAEQHGSANQSLVRRPCAMSEISDSRAWTRLSRSASFSVKPPSIAAGSVILRWYALGPRLWIDVPSGRG